MRRRIRIYIIVDQRLNEFIPYLSKQKSIQYTVKTAPNDLSESMIIQDHSRVSLEYRYKDP